MLLKVMSPTNNYGKYLDFRELVGCGLVQVSDF